MKWRGAWCSWEEGMGRRIKWELAVHPFLPTPLTPSTGFRIRIRFLKLWSSLVQHSWISITYWTWASVSFIITASRYHLTQDIMSLADFHPHPHSLTPAIDSVPASSSVQLLSGVWLSLIPQAAARQASLSITSPRSLLTLMSIEWVTPSLPGAL